MRIQRKVWKTLSRAAAVLLAVGVVGCKAAGPDVAGDVCQKADSCQALSGISVTQCKNVIDTSLASKSGGARTDLENAYRGCVAMTSCDGFRSCVDGLMGGSSEHVPRPGRQGCLNARHGTLRSNRRACLDCARTAY